LQAQRSSDSVLCVRTLHFVMRRSYRSKFFHKLTPYSSSCSVLHSSLAIMTFYGRRRFNIAFEKAATDLYPEIISASPHRHIPFLQFQLPYFINTFLRVSLPKKPAAISFPKHASHMLHSSHHYWYDHHKNLKPVRSCSYHVATHCEILFTVLLRNKYCCIRGARVATSQSGLGSNSGSWSTKQVS